VAFDFRGRAPLFLGDTMTLCAADGPSGMRLEARTGAGAIAMTGHAHF
jgi:hydroxyacyl-ACP dehydratase HTD2-like protein with hotdog domain